MNATPCPFCEIIHGRAPAKVIDEWLDAIAIRPLNPVVPGHVLVLPHVHVESFKRDYAISGLTMQRAADLADRIGGPCNIITSVGRAATQTVDHLHVHIVPRQEGDGLHLPWTGQEATK